MRKTLSRSTPVISALFAVVLAAFFSGCGHGHGKLTADFIQAEKAAYEKGDVNALDKFYAAEYIHHVPPLPEIKGLEAYKKAIQSFRLGLTNPNLTIEETVSDGNLSASRWTFAAVDQASGKSFRYTGCQMTRWKDGKAVESWQSADYLGMYQQLGFKMLPPLTPATLAMVSAAQLKPGKVEDLVKLENEISMPLVKSYKGFHGYFFLGDVKTGKVFSISIWDSQDVWNAGMKDEKVKAYFADFTAKTKDFFVVKPAQTGYRVLLQE